MSTKIKVAVRAVLAGAVLSVASSGVYAADGVHVARDWDAGDNTVGANDSIRTTPLDGGSPGNMSWTDNSDLNFSPWGHAVQWFTFQVTAANQVVTIKDQVVAGNSNRAFTVWASNGEFDGGSLFTGESRGGNSYGNGAPHSFNAVGQLGDPGTLWMSDASIAKTNPSVDPEVFAGGGNMARTLAYVNAGNAHTDSATTDWGEVINAGVNQVDHSGAYFSGVSGSYSASVAELVFTNLAVGWYAVAAGGANASLDPIGLSHQLSVTTTSAVPLPGAVYLFGTALAGLVASARRKQILA